MHNICQDPRGEAIGILQSMGGQPSHIIPEKLQRIKGERCKGSEKDLWYVYHELEDTYNEGKVIGRMTYGYHKDNSTFYWSSRSESAMSGVERESYRQAVEQARQQYEDDKLQRQEEAAATAFKIWSEAKAAKSHPYLTKKGVKTTQGIKIAKDGRLIVPLAVDNQIVSLQYINDDGEKRFLTGGRIKGGWFVIEGETDVVYIAEGYSTGKSVAEATGKTVYIAFNAGNLYEVCSYVRSERPHARLIIAGDDDTETTGNAGRTKAEQVSAGLSIEVIFPVGYIDFNDMHHDLGIKALRDFLVPANDDIEVYEEEDKAGRPKDPIPTGVMRDIYDYYNATTGNDQKGFSTQTAIAVVSTVLGRLFKTNTGNYTSLYLMNVGKTATGKEHAKYVAEKILTTVGQGHLIAGDGYTSAGAVSTTLLDRPNHYICVDEVGRYLEASMGKAGMNSHLRESNTKLMEIYNRCDGTLRPQNYSAMTAKKSDADNIKNRLIYNPCVTWLSMTTPSTLFATIDINAVKDGFINRFVVSISDAEPDIRHHKEELEVPQSIIDWVSAIIERNPDVNIATQPANPIVIPFSSEAFEAQIQFQRELLVIRKSLERYGMDGLVGRTNEQAMRISLDVALSNDPHAKVVSLDDITWGIDYMRNRLMQMIDVLKLSISHSDFDAHKKEILTDIRGRGKDGVTKKEMQVEHPYSQHKGRDLDEIMRSLKDADLVVDETYKPEGGGRPSIKWTALK